MKFNCLIFSVLIFFLSCFDLSAKEILTFNTLTAEAERCISEDNPVAGENELKRVFVAIYDEEIHIKGFLQFSDENQWSLSAQSSIKSCCIGNKNKAFLQVFLDTNFNKEDIGKMVTLGGNFHIDIKTDAEGKVQQVYHISKVSSIETEKNNTSIFWGFIAIGACFVLIILGIVKKNFQ